MGERFLDKVLHFMGIQEEDHEQVAASDELAGRNQMPADEETTPRRGRIVNLPPREVRSDTKSRRVSMSALPAEKWHISVLEPTSFEDVQGICDHLKQRRPVLVSVEELDKELSKRIIDFVSGTTYAIDGQVQRVSEGIFLFVPQDVHIEAVLQREWEGEEH